MFLIIRGIRQNGAAIFCDGDNTRDGVDGYIFSIIFLTGCETATWIGVGSIGIVCFGCFTHSFGSIFTISARFFSRLCLTHWHLCVDWLSLFYARWKLTLGYAVVCIVWTIFWLCPRWHCDKFKSCKYKAVLGFIS